MSGRDGRRLLEGALDDRGHADRVAPGVRLALITGKTFSSSSKLVSAITFVDGAAGHIRRIAAKAVQPAPRFSVS